MRQVDPSAGMLLDRLVAAHQALFSFSADVKVEAVSDARNETTQASIVYMKPNKARVELKLAQGARIVSVCDGTTRLYSDGKKHQKLKAESGEKAIIETLSQTGLLIAPVFLYLTSRSAPVRTILPGATKVLGFTTPTTLDGVLVDVVAADIETKDGKGRLVFSIGKDDRLLRRLEINTSNQRQSLSLVESYTNVKANPKLDKKAFLLAP